MIADRSLVEMTYYRRIDRVTSGKLDDKDDDYDDDDEEDEEDQKLSLSLSQ